jgi:phage protein D
MSSSSDTEQSKPAQVKPLIYSRLKNPAIGSPSTNSPNGTVWQPYQVVQLPTTSYPTIANDQSNPNSPPANTKLQTEDTNATKTARAKEVAKNLCKQKNRKFRRQHITIAFNPAVESGTIYTLQGFSPYLDGAWLVTQVIHSFSAKGGTTTEIDLQKAITEY